jgi:hypothetical protein
MPPNDRLTHGECVPTSIAIRHRFRAPNTRCIAFLVVATLSS